MSGLLSFGVDISTNLVNQFLFPHNEYLSFSIQWKCFFLKLLVYLELTPVCMWTTSDQEMDKFHFWFSLFVFVLLVCCIEKGVNPEIFVVFLSIYLFLDLVALLIFFLPFSKHNYFYYL